MDCDCSTTRRNISLFVVLQNQNHIKLVNYTICRPSTTSSTLLTVVSITLSADVPVLLSDVIVFDTPSDTAFAADYYWF